ncbi:MAG: antitoxin Xre/MbcA/ParS toxin-binding domain-containing protein [Candidatus Limnocylindria bacterium]
MRRGAAIARRRPAGRAGAPARSLVSEVRHRLEWLTSVLGSNQVADLLGVSRSQPSRWRSGAEGPAAHNQRALLDLDYVITRLHQLWTPDVAAIWLESPNAHLGGATPLDVLRQRGPTDVVQAIDAEAEGAYA